MYILVKLKNTCKENILKCTQGSSGNDLVNLFDMALLVWWWEIKQGSGRVKDKNSSP